MSNSSHFNNDSEFQRVLAEGQKALETSQALLDTVKAEQRQRADKIFQREDDSLRQKLDQTICTILDRVIEQNRQSTNTISGNSSVEPKGKAKGRPKNGVVAKRRQYMVTFAEKGLQGELYCRAMDQVGVGTPVTWRLEGCPAKYLDAWNHPNPVERKKWRQRISNEKSQATSNKARTSN
jgi:hypothetical protein